MAPFCKRPFPSKSICYRRYGRSGTAVAAGGAITTATVLPVVLNPIDEPHDWLTGAPTAPVAIRNREGQPTPTGVIGELHVGANLRPTGDVWRWVENGRLQFRRYHPHPHHHPRPFGGHRRRGHQLARQPRIHACVVLPDDAPCDKRQLHAYVVTNQPLETAQLEQLAKQQLPPQFVPVLFHVLEEIPVTTVGDIDYRALQTRQQTEQPSQETDSRAAKQAELAARRDNLSAKKQTLLASGSAKRWPTKTKRRAFHRARPTSHCRFPLPNSACGSLRS